MKNRIVIMSALILLTLLVVVSCSREKDKSEITVEKAIHVATNIAASKNYDTQNTAIEVIKYKKEIEKGPIRTMWLFQTFPKDEAPKLMNNEFWLVYFYPKKTTVIGGDFCVLVDLYTGKVISSIAGK